MAPALTFFALLDVHQGLDDDMHSIGRWQIYIKSIGSLLMGISMDRMLFCISSTFIFAVFAAGPCFRIELRNQTST